VKTVGTRGSLDLYSIANLSADLLAVAARFSFRELCFGRERVERTLERKPAAMAEMEGRPGQRCLTETLMRKLLDFARQRGLGHSMTSLRSLFP